MQNNCLQAALEYAENFHWSVIPLSPSTKIPPKDFSLMPFRNRIASRKEIEAWWRENPRYNVGIITGKLSKLLAIDHDKYKLGYSEERALEYIPDNIVTPTSSTPRGGLHQLFVFPDTEISIGVELIPGLDYRGEGGYIVAPPSVNGNGKGYKWLISPGEAEPAILPCALKSALYNKNNNSYNRGGVDSSVDSEEFFSEGRRDNDLYHTANILVKGGMPENEIRQVLKRLIVSWGESPDPKWIDAKISSALKRSERRDRTLSTDVREWVLSTSGVFLSSDIYSCLQVSTRDDKKNVSIILKRMCDDGEIERSGNKNGCFRRLDNEIEPLDWRNADITPLPLRWPFGIERLVHVYPGNIAVIAGAPNAGKTSFILNFIKMNQQNHAVHLFSSEGGKEELNMRISKFDAPLDSWTFKAWDRSGDFADVIKPDAINIVDYLELHDDFFKVGGMLKAISDRLKRGFCLIALQKNSGRDEGLGGARGLEKPRLYLAMDNGVLKIVKGKSWADRMKNPNGQSIRFKLVDGCKFIVESRWEREV